MQQRQAGALSRLNARAISGGEYLLQRLVFHIYHDSSAVALRHYACRLTST